MTVFMINSCLYANMLVHMEFLMKKKKIAQLPGELRTIHPTVGCEQVLIYLAVR